MGKRGAEEEKGRRKGKRSGVEYIGTGEGKRREEERERGERKKGGDKGQDTRESGSKDREEEGTETR